MTSGNLMIVQGGGPTAVFNASLSSVIEEASRAFPGRKIFGAQRGTFGLTHGEFFELDRLSADDLRMLRHSPGAALCSSRFRPAEDDLPKQIDNLRKLDVTAILFMGGNGTMRGAQIVSSTCRAAGLEVQVIGIPKTIDNDIAVTDRCPGYGSAARYIAQSTRELGMDVRSLPQPVTVLETMGRNVGWIAAAATLAQVDPCDAPHLVYVPEVAFDTEVFLADLEKILSSQGWAVVVVAEGIRNADGNLVYENTDPVQQDSLKRSIVGGIGQHLAGLVAKNLKIRCRSEKPGLLGRASMAHLSKQDYDDALLVGRAAIEALARGDTDKMVALRGLQNQDTHCFDLVPLSEVAGAERTIPTAWLTEGPLAVSDEFRRYARPLVGELNRYIPNFTEHLSLTGAC